MDGGVCRGQHLAPGLPIPQRSGTSPLSPGSKGPRWWPSKSRSPSPSSSPISPCPRNTLDFAASGDRQGRSRARCLIMSFFPPCNMFSDEHQRAGYAVLLPNLLYTQMGLSHPQGDRKKRGGHTHGSLLQTQRKAAAKPLQLTAGINHQTNVSSSITSNPRSRIPRAPGFGNCPSEDSGS